MPNAPQRPRKPPTKRPRNRTPHTAAQALHMPERRPDAGPAASFRLPAETPHLASPPRRRTRLWSSRTHRRTPSRACGNLRRGKPEHVVRRNAAGLNLFGSNRHQAVLEIGPFQRSRPTQPPAIRLENAKAGEGESFARSGLSHANAVRAISPGRTPGASSCRWACPDTNRPP